VLRTLNPAEVAWDVERAGEAEAEMDEMWSFVGNKDKPPGSGMSSITTFETLRL
jgi:hypothetical protein